MINDLSRIYYFPLVTGLLLDDFRHMEYTLLAQSVIKKKEPNSYSLSSNYKLIKKKKDC